jgi:hypothetical protein
MEKHGESSHSNICGCEQADGHKHDVRDFIIDGKKELNETGEEKEDCSVHQERNVLDYPACMKLLHAIEKVSTKPDSTSWRRGKLSEPEVSASPLLHKCSTEGARETEKETEEP